MQSTKEFFHALNPIPQPIKNGWSYLDRIPQQEFYRLIVDGDLLISEQGPLEYEKREPGCIESFMHALCYCQEMKGRRVEFLDLLNMHSLLSSHRSRDANFPKLRGRRWDVHFGVTRKSASAEGILDYLKALERDGHVVWGQLSIAGERITRTKLPKIRAKYSLKNNVELANYLYENMQEHSSIWPTNPEGLAANYTPLAMMALLNSYYHRIDPAMTQLEKIRIMIEAAVQPIEVMHAFSDVNCRLSIVLLLNTLLMNEGLPPAIFNDPNQFDLHSVDQCIQIVLEGMQRTLQLIEKGTLPGFNLTDLTSEEQLLVTAITQKVSVNDMTERLNEFTTTNIKFSDYLQEVYRTQFQGFEGDPFNYLRYIIQACEIADHIDVGQLMNHFESAEKPLDECIPKAKFWRHQLVFPNGQPIPTWMIGDHAYQMGKAWVSEQGLKCLFDKMESGEDSIHLRIGITTIAKHGPISKFNIAKTRDELGCNTNTELAKLIYNTEAYWPMRHWPVYNDTFRVNASYCLKLIRENYEQQIVSADTVREKILVIVETIQELCLTMPFKNQNSEQLVPLINKLLLENGLPPVTKFGYAGKYQNEAEVDYFILFSPDELADMVTEKCCSALAIIRGVPEVAVDELSSPLIWQDLQSTLKVYAKIRSLNETLLEVPTAVYRKIQGQRTNVTDDLPSDEINIRTSI